MLGRTFVLLLLLLSHRSLYASFYTPSHYSPWWQQYLKVATFNGGFFKPRFDPFHFLGVAKYKQRSAVLNEEMQRYLQTHQPQAFFLQEFWQTNNRRDVCLAANNEDYKCLSRDLGWPENYNSHGMEILVPAHTEIIATGFVKYGSLEKRYEKLYGARRGVLYAVVRFARTLPPILLANTHLSQKGSHKEQALTFAQRVAEIAQRYEAPVIVFGGDLNLDVDREPKSQELQREMFRILAQWDVIDSFREDGVHEPNLDPGFTQHTKPFYFGNTLYPPNQVALSTFSSRREDNKRLDYLYWGIQWGSSLYAHKESARLIFNTPAAFEDCQYCLSDHYGIEVLVSLMMRVTVRSF